MRVFDSGFFLIAGLLRGLYNMRSLVSYWIVSYQLVAMRMECFSPHENGGDSSLKRSRVSLCFDFVARFPPRAVDQPIYISLTLFSYILCGLWTFKSHTISYFHFSQKIIRSPFFI